MAWKRFPIPEFDHRPLRGLTYTPPVPISKTEEDSLVATALSGDESGVGAYAVEPNADLLEKLSFNGDHRQMIMCIVPAGDCRLLGRSMAWYNQRAYVLDGNSADAEIIHEWHTPRTHNTRLGPDDGVSLDRRVIYLLSGRILEDEDRGNRVMIDADWSPGDGRAGYRILAGCDKGDDNFHDTCLMISWPQ